MNTVKLGSVCGVLSGFAFKSSQFGQSGMPIVRIRDVVRGFSETFYSGEYDEQFVIDNGDILIGMDGDFNLAEWGGGKALLNQRVCKLLIDEENWSKKFLYYFLPIKLLEIWHETPYVTVKHLSVKKIINIDIPNYPLETQKKIAAILEKADQLRKDCQQMEQELNNLGQSVFMDMFGDPVSNPKGWERRILSEFYCDEKTGTKCGPFGSALKKEDFSDSGVPVWNMDNITLSGSFIDEPSLFVPKEKHEALQSYSVMPGDVIISRAGTVGKMGVVYSKHPESLISTNLIRVRFGQQMLPEYFVSLMLYCKTRLKRLKVGADGDFSHMNTGILDQLEFPYPPIEIQRQYVEYLGKIDRELINLKDLSAEFDEQFQSLSTKAFSGQLIANNKAA